MNWNIKKRFFLALTLVLTVFLILVSTVLADIPVSHQGLCDFASLNPEECSKFTNEQLCSYPTEQLVETFFDSQTDTCYFIDSSSLLDNLFLDNLSSDNLSSDNLSLSSAASSSADESSLSEISETELTEIKTSLSTLEQKLSSLETSQSSQAQQLSEIKNNLQTLNSQLNQQLNSVSTGLAGLQTNLTNLEEVETELANKTSFTAFLTYFLFVVLILGVAFALIYYLTRGKNLSLPAYIHRQLQKKKSFSEIKSALLQKGWSEELINWAHQKALKAKTPFPLSSIPTPNTELKILKPLTPNSKKILAVILISLLLISGLVLLVSETNFGKAIQYTLEGKGHKIDIVCSPPQILSPNGFSCCTDANQNNLCDLDESYESKKALQDSPICLDDRYCTVGKLCIDKKCQSLSELSQPDCPVQCKIISADISTSDNEIYHPIIGRGGYTAAGALEWTLLPSPVFCSPNEARLPIEITRKKSVLTFDAAGKKKTEIKIVSKEVITLKKGQSSRVLRHFSAPNLAFTLTLNNLNIKCY